ncbi:MAG: hypothetical protein ACRD01_15885 [Terriglobales bacterium]
MKTTLELDAVLLRAAKRAALDRGTSLKGLVETALRRELTSPRRRRLKILSVPGGAPPGIESREKMWQWFDEHGHRG